MPRACVHAHACALAGGQSPHPRAVSDVRTPRPSTARAQESARRHDTRRIPLTVSRANRSSYGAPRLAASPVYVLDAALQHGHDYTRAGDRASASSHRLS